MGRESDVQTDRIECMIDMKLVRCARYVQLIHVEALLRRILLRLVVDVADAEFKFTHMVGGQLRIGVCRAAERKPRDAYHHSHGYGRSLHVGANNLAQVHRITTAEQTRMQIVGFSTDGTLAAYR